LTRWGCEEEEEEEEEAGVKPVRDKTKRRKRGIQTSGSMLPQHPDNVASGIQYKRTKQNILVNENTGVINGE
jgi:hypothetical protein